MSSRGITLALGGPGIMAFGPCCCWHPMKPIDFETLQRAVDHPHARSRDILFAGLASSRAAWRARAAEGLLKRYGGERADNRTLAQSFGRSPEAIFSRQWKSCESASGSPPPRPGPHSARVRS